MAEEIRTIYCEVKLEIDTNKRTINKTIRLHPDTLGELKRKVNDTIYDVAEEVSM